MRVRVRVRVRAAAVASRRSVQRTQQSGGGIVPVHTNMTIQLGTRLQRSVPARLHLKACLNKRAHQINTAVL